MSYCRSIPVLMLAAVLVCFFVMSETETAVVPLDSKNTQNLDLYVRRQMLISLNEKLKAKVPEYSKLRESCERTLKLAVEKCKLCTDKQKETMDSPLYKLLTILFLPDILYTEYLKFQARVLKEVVQFLGEHAKKFLEGLTGLTGTISSTLEDGIKNMKKMAIKGLEHLTEQLGNSVKDIAKFTVKGIQDVSKGVGKLAEETGKILEDLGKGLTDTAGKVIDMGKETVGNTVKAVTDVVKGAADAVGGVVKAISNPISNIRISLPRIGGWGKKKRALRRKAAEYGLVTKEKFKRELNEMLKRALVEAKIHNPKAKLSGGKVSLKKRIIYEHILDLGSCPICEKIDSEKRSVEAIMDELCADTRRQEKELLKTIKSAERLFDFIRNQTVITAVGFDPAAYSVGAQGLSYSKVYVNATVDGKTYYFRPSASLNYANINGMGDTIVGELIAKTLL